MAHLKAQETAHDLDARYQGKFGLIRQLYQRGYARQDILELLRFIDWVLILPQELAKALAIEIEQLEEQQPMPYVTSFERIGMEKGLQQGRQQGRQEGLQEGIQEGRQVGEAALIIRLLQRRFGELSVDLKEHITRLDLSRLESLGDALLDFQSMAEVEAWLHQAMLDPSP